MEYLALLVAILGGVLNHWSKRGLTEEARVSRAPARNAGNALLVAGGIGFLATILYEIGMRVFQ